MFSFTEKNRNEIEMIARHFAAVFPDIPYEKLYNRIFDGYCWGEEGKGFPIRSIKAWEAVLYNRKGNPTYASWEDYDNSNKES